MNAIDLTPLYRSSVGFDRLGSLLDSVLASDSTSGRYPPYNIESTDDNRYAITLAVAGFTRDELDIQFERGVLTIRGHKESSDERNYLHQGIDDQTFERTFSLADYIEVTGADLSNGLLTINLVKEVPEAMKPKTIEIVSGSKVLEHNSKGKKSQDDKAA